MDQAAVDPVSLLELVFIELHLSLPIKLVLFELALVVFRSECQQALTLIVAIFPFPHVECTVTEFTYTWPRDLVCDLVLIAAET